MPFSVKLEKFEGPLDILLQLIEQEQLEISEVSLSQVTDGFLKMLDANPQIPLEELVDFLVVASKLLFIKSRLLLPLGGLTGEEEGPTLETQLRIYKEYLDASKVIHNIIGKRRFLFVHDKLPKIDIGFSPPEGFGTAEMAAMMTAAVKRLEVLVHVPSAILEKTVSIHEKINEIRGLLKRVKRSSFRSMLLSAGNRTEIVVCFLALLELVKQRAVTVSQDGQFNDIMLAHADEPEEEAETHLVSKEETELVPAL
ncbi:hypothetical protein A3C96_01260 [Candidatus Uhrbacteria bacterium RIFCSPHIGHO2_02_FULL_60_10]|uniref:Segregation and condensation protein A n=1 Tax=Candidatus Uhrbacteria bacterium RIFCSPHIGHO2_02_FULL_60_10 TaxID=1802392 RepID=A0A1F7U8F1_9BACT|nr:MAG: hypothetical protein A3C96_01260 [Candidatus Uhrbacteria bacterium RIFCSPHIGHO2_02_FULL_60_10]